jgi:Spy/CpxP family protein refolding chaperone
MKVRKMINTIAVLGMITALSIVSSGNLYAAEPMPQEKLEKIEIIVADLQLTDSQKAKFQDFKSSLRTEPVVKQEKNMEFVNKLLDIPVF